MFWYSNRKVTNIPINLKKIIEMLFYKDHEMLSQTYLNAYIRGRKREENMEEIKACILSAVVISIDNVEKRMRIC